MANRAKFDRIHVIDIATELFWKQGYYNTSTRDLQKSLDMRQASIYSAFGNKQGLFMAAIDNYVAQVSTQLERTIAESESVLEALRDFFLDVLIYKSHAQPTSMCFLAKSLHELYNDEELGPFIQSHLQDLEKKYTELLAQAIERKELSPTADPVALGSMLQIELMGLRTYTAGSGREDFVVNYINELFDRLKNK